MTYKLINADDQIKIKEQQALIRNIALMVYTYMMHNKDKEIARIFMIEDRFPEED